MIALIDNHDSFTYNLIYLLKSLGQKVESFYPEHIDEQILKQASHILISPGPRHPKDSPINLEIILKYCSLKPILGVCLGHQCIAYAFGGEVIQGEPTHGKTSKIHFSDHQLFAGLNQGAEMMRYHSLIVQNLPEGLKAIAWNEDGIIMAIKHKIFPLYGIQFHPESILSKGGEILLKNFIAMR